MKTIAVVEGEGVELCGCGSCRDVMKDAMSILKEKVLDSEKCYLYKLAVANQMMAIMCSIFDEVNMEVATQGGEMNADIAAAVEYFAHEEENRQQRLFALSFASSPDMCKEKADFVCEEAGSKHSHATISAGPNEEYMNSLGLFRAGKMDAHSFEMKKLLEALLGSPRSKPN